MQEQWSNIKKYNIYIIGILEREKGAEETLEVTNILV